MRPHGAIALALAATTVGFSATPPRDRKPPTTPTVDGQLAPTDLRPVFHFGATDDRTTRAQLRFRCAVDGAALGPCAHIYRPFSGLTFGPHVLRVRALDRAGNQGHVAVYAFRVVGTWDAAKDFGRAPRPENPGRDRYGNTSWFYLFSGTTAHDPTDYHALPVFDVINPDFQAWRSTPAPFPNGTTVGVCVSCGQISMQPGHYALGQNAILGWRSPVASSIRLHATIWQNQSTCGDVPQNGIIWSIDQGAKTLQSGRLAPGASKNIDTTTTLAAGESLYVIVDGNGDTNCDGTLVDLTLMTQ